MQTRRFCVYKKEEHFSKRRFLVAVFLLIALLLYALFQLEEKVRPIASEIAEYQSKTIAVKAIQQACNSVLNERPILYKDLYHIQRASNGQIQSIENDTLRINTLEDALVDKVNESLAELKTQPIRIALGTLSGMQILSGYGPQIMVQTMPLSLVTSQVSTRFCSEGINQTKFEIYVHFEAEMGTVLAGFTQTFPVETDIVIAQVLIVGQVPQMYVQGSK